MPASAARLGLPLLLYAGLVAWLTWPLATHLATHLAATTASCRVDTSYMTWVLAFETHALTTDPLRLADANIFHPARHALFYGDTGFGALPYFLPVFLATGNPTLAINLTCFGCIALTAWTLHLVTVRWTGEPFAGFAAAATYLANPWVLWTFVPSAPAFAVLQYLPLIVFVAARPAARFTEALRLLPLLVLQALADVAYVAPAVFAPLGIVAVARLGRRETRIAGVRLLAVLALGALALAPIYAAHIGVRGELPGPDATWWSTTVGPTSLPWGPFCRGPTAVSLPTAALIALGALAFAARARRVDAAGTRRAWTHAAAWTAVGLYISLTPTVRTGATLIWLPDVAALSAAVRAPDRLGVAALIGTALLAGLAFAECVRRLPVRHRATALAVRAVAAALLVGALRTRSAAAGGGAWYPLTPAIAPKPRSRVMGVLRRPGGPLLELPASIPPRLAEASGMLEVPVFADVRAMYRSIHHWRPLLNGYSSYWPRGHAERIALAQELPDPAALAALRRETGLELLLVHVGDYASWRHFVCRVPRAACARDGDIPSRAWLAAAAGRRDLRLVASEGPDELLFRVVEGP
jgi:hypothetical protein